MGIFKRKKIHNQLNLNLEKASQIYNKAFKCLTPAHNIYWCYTLDPHGTFNDEARLDELQRAIPLLIIYINQFQKLFFVNEKLCLDYNIKGYSNEFFISNLEKLDTNITSTISDIKSLPIYNSTPKLKNAIQLLQSASAQTQNALLEIEKQLSITVEP